MAVDVIQVLLTVCLEKSSHLKKQIEYFCIILSSGFFLESWVKYCKLQFRYDFSSCQQYSNNFTYYYRTTSIHLVKLEFILFRHMFICLLFGPMNWMALWLFTGICFEQRDSGECPKWRGFFCLIFICPDRRK